MSERCRRGEGVQLMVGMSPGPWLDLLPLGALWAGVHGTHWDPAAGSRCLCGCELCSGHCLSRSVERTGQGMEMLYISQGSGTWKHVQELHQTPQ